MRRVIIESPFAGSVQSAVEANIAYARAAVRDCLMRGEAPLASHLLYTQPGILNDADKIERALGIDAGHAWLRFADAMVVYQDMGISPGMVIGIRRAVDAGIPVEYRNLPVR